MFLKAPGNYEYLIARTKFIDNIFENMDDNIEQVLIFGAGFDSRAIRFKNKLASTKIFELDVPVTQKIKMDRIKRKNIEIPENLKFISIDLYDELDSARLAKKYFNKDDFGLIAQKFRMVMANKGGRIEFK
ncbi:class I SAM-dependent methyltransferase [Anaerospora hongkongensis]|uniref:class I SAM-dependent methyltransferase n=1 Tax=Anaerospora hongkongensis TaxID=244830 RepID=UPI00289A5C30|nr:class I SAM-dependent methyltransferase [Anaerospora hongkongensis]